MYQSNIRVKSNTKINAIICADIKQQNEIGINIDNMDSKMININNAQRIRNRKIINIKNQITDLKQQIILIQQYSHDDNIKSASLYKSVSKDCNTFAKLETRITKNTDLQKWNILLNESVQLLKSHKNIDNSIGTINLKSIHTQIRALPDDLIRYIHDYLSYDNRISLLEYKYRLYNQLLEHPNHIFRSIISRIMQQQYCNICINCPKCMGNNPTCIKPQCDLCKGCNDCIEVSEINRYIQCRPIKYITLVFRGFILKNKSLTPKKIYDLIRKTILLSIVQTKYNNK